MKKSIGQFIAALRKANGMTQQDIADRLNVSNKAVSRWERDECAPDISLIPALAELLGVSCDELLKGERIFGSEPEKKDPKVDKQVKTLLNRTLSDFKMMIWVAFAAAAVGLILMFGIAYGFYRPVVGFTVMLLFEAGAFVLTLLAVTRTLDIKRCNDIFDMADDTQLSHFNKVCANLSFWSFFSVLSAVVLSLPLILYRPNGVEVESVVTLETYLRYIFIGIVIVLVFVYLQCKKPYISWIMTGRLGVQRPDRAAVSLNVVQLGMLILAAVALVTAPYFMSPNDKSFGTYDILVVSALAVMALSIVYFAIFIIIHKDRKKYILSGIRNVCFLPAALIASLSHYVTWSYYGYFEVKVITYKILHYWDLTHLWYAVVYCMVIYMIFAVINAIIETRKNKRIKGETNEDHEF